MKTFQMVFFKPAVILLIVIPLFSFFLPELTKKKKPNPLLYAYYIGDGTSGLHLAWSEDGFKWQALKNGKSFVKPGIGDYLMRDPHLFQDTEGIFHLVWATGLNRKEIGYAYSRNLIDWSLQRTIPVMENDSVVLNAWAPELLFDVDNKRFMLFWASSVPGKFRETEKQNDSLPNGYRYNHRIYRKFSTDLKEWTTTELFFDPGFNCTDPTISSDSGKVMMFYKDATQMGKNIQNNIRMSTSGIVGGGFSTKPSLVSRRAWAEAPTGIRLDSQFVVYFHKYRTRKMGAVLTKDFKKWNDVSDSISFPKGVQHGTVLRIPVKTMEKLREL